jgi:hypothetical protein
MVHESIIKVLTAKEHVTVGCLGFVDGQEGDIASQIEDEDTQSKPL